MSKELSLALAARKPRYEDRGMPSQTVTVKEKNTKEWGQANMNFLRDEARSQNREKLNDIKKYKMLSDTFEYKESMQWVTDPLNHGDQRDETYGPMDDIQHYPIMNGPLFTIWGERINRPVQFYCVSEAPESRNDYYEEKTEQLFDYIIKQKTQIIYQRYQMQGQEITPELQKKIQEQDVPQKIQQYVDNDFVDVTERVSNRILKNLYNKSNLDVEFIEGFRHATICGKEFYRFNVVGYNVKVTNLDPFSIFYHKSPSCRWVSESQYAGYRLFLTPSSVIDLYREKLKIEDIKYLEDRMSPSQGKGGYNSLTGIKSIDYDTSTYVSFQGELLSESRRTEIDDMVDNFWTHGSSGMSINTMGYIEVIEAFWKSYRKIGWLHWYDEEDNEMIDMVDEHYEADEDKGEWINWQYINQVYHGIMIDDLYVQHAPYKHQVFDMDDPDYSPLPIEGVVYSEFAGKIMALTDLMMPWAELYDLVAHELKRDMKKAIGKVMFMDHASIPNIEGFDMDKWMYWCREFGIAWVDGKSKSNFAHFSAQDMSFADQLIAKMQMLDKIKQNCEAFAGFSQPRLANTTQEQTAQQSQMSNVASVNQTEYFFWKHSQVIKKVLTHGINIQKKLLPDDPNLRNMFDDMEMRYIQTDGANIRDAKLSIFVQHGSKDIAKRETARQIAMSAAGKQADPLDMVDIVFADTETEIRKIMKSLRRKQNEMQQQAQQSEQMGLEQQQAQHAEMLQWEKEKHYSSLESEERQEYMRTFINQEDNLKDADANGVPDILEQQKFFEQQADNIRKDNREREKNRQDAKLKERELKIKEEGNRLTDKNMENDLKITRMQTAAKARIKK